MFATNEILVPQYRFLQQHLAIAIEWHICFAKN